MSLNRRLEFLEEQRNKPKQSMTLWQWFSSPDRDNMLDQLSPADRRIAEGFAAHSAAVHEPVDAIEDEILSIEAQALTYEQAPEPDQPAIPARRLIITRTLPQHEQE